MDPVVNLQRQRELAESIMALNGSLEVRETGKPTRAVWDFAPELAELVLAMHEWRRNGGFDLAPSTTIAQMTTNAVRYYNAERLEREIAFARAALDESDDGTILWLAAVLTEQEHRNAKSV